MMMKLSHWKVAVLIISYYLIYIDKLVLPSAAVNHRLADKKPAAGFISIDCGMVAKSRYDDDTGLYFSSDAAFIDTGRIMNVKIEHNSSYLPLYNSLRSFPNGTRNCYTLKPLQGRNSSYLIRAHFHYGNYDGLSSIPNFNLHIGVNYWTTVQPDYIKHRFFHEVIYAPADDFIYVCLVNTNSGTPFISALELRPVNNTAYKYSSGALILNSRFDAGAVKDTSFYYSVIDDPYDRQWAVVQPPSATWDSLRSNVSMNSTYTDAYKLPPSVSETAAIPVHGSDSLHFHLNESMDGLVQVYWHFAEIQKLGINDSREFAISLNGNLQSRKISPTYLQLLTIVSTATKFNDTPLEFSITRTTKSTLPPILNAFEIYFVLDLPKSATYQDDVNAVMNIKMNYTVLKGWQGDPCLPIPAWDGLNCSHSDDNQSPRITSLNLAMKGLVGNIPHSLSALTSLEYLNLSCNSLTGAIPDYLAELPSLHTLDLRNNKLTGQVPIALQKKIEDGSLYLSLGDRPDLCASNPYKKKNRKKIGVIIAAAASITFIAAGVVVFCKCKPKKQAKSTGRMSITSESRKFTYLEVMNMTDNCKDIIGKGGSGTVYNGFLKDGACVAVKVLNPSSTLSLKLFHTEAELLARVHHRNLVSLIGYCEEGATLALIYEHVTNGNLQQHLAENNVKVFSWKERLQIAIDAAQGLEYLHSGCKPSIVHRDMKTSNILLDENLHAKISDFGISKAFSIDSTESALTTNVVGTHGYLDPEYYITRRLNKKSDVYSFGVVLLELITGHPPIIRSSAQPIHVIAWTAPKLESGDIDNIVDKRLRGNFSMNSAWKALETAMVCVSTAGIQRPNMNQVLIDLNDSLAIEIAHERPRETGYHEYTYPFDNDNAIADTSMEMGPSAR